MTICKQRETLPMDRKMENGSRCESRKAFSLSKKATE